MVGPRRNVFTVERLRVALVVTGSYCRSEEQGNVVLRTVFDNVLEPKLCIKIVRESGVGAYERIVIRAARFYRTIAAHWTPLLIDKHQKLRPLA